MVLKNKKAVLKKKEKLSVEMEVIEETDKEGKMKGMK